MILAPLTVEDLIKLNKVKYKCACKQSIVVLDVKLVADPWK